MVSTEITRTPPNGPKAAIGRSFRKPFASHWGVLAVVVFLARPLDRK